MTSNTETATAQEASEKLRTDPALADLIEKHGTVTLDPATDTFERLIVSLLRQQVSMAAASAIRERLFDHVEITPDGILDADESTLRDAGLSAAKVEYVTAVANAYRERGYSREYFEGMDDDAVLAELTEIRGVGPWTGKMFLMFALGRQDVFPVEDLGIRRGMERICQQEMTRGEMRQRAQEWTPYRSYASLYLWRAYEG